jgi:hypothetical protein
MTTILVVEKLLRVVNGQMELGDFVAPLPNPSPVGRGASSKGEELKHYNTPRFI